MNTEALCPLSATRRSGCKLGYRPRLLLWLAMAERCALARSAASRHCLGLWQVSQGWLLGREPYAEFTADEARWDAPPGCAHDLRRAPDRRLTSEPLSADILQGAWQAASAGRREEGTQFGVNPGPKILLCTRQLRSKQSSSHLPLLGRVSAPSMTREEMMQHPGC